VEPKGGVMTSPRPVLLVGSVPLPTATAVFEAVAETLGDLVRRIPDGETGARLVWILCQQSVVAQARGLELAEVRDLQGGYKIQRYRVPQGGRASDVELGTLGYAEWAKQSYAEFARLKAQGKLPHGMRFQVSLPSPFDIVWAFFPPSDQEAIWPVYEQAMAAELDEIARAIPHADLSIQWDMSSEFTGIIEFPAQKARFPLPRLASAIARLSERVPQDVELGLHCCYGDPGHKHLVEPTDTANLVEFGNLLLKTIRRPVTWLHMPVPKERHDDAYFAPLERLELPAATELYLGLIHLTDGVAGAERRIAAAKKVVPKFGVATECGFGRRTPETMPALLALHRAVAQLD
jgi:hypothetical protein